MYQGVPTFFSNYSLVRLGRYHLQCHLEALKERRLVNLGVGDLSLRTDQLRHSDGLSEPKLPCSWRLRRHERVCTSSAIVINRAES